MEIQSRPDLLLFGVIVAVAFVILGLVSVIRQATRNSSAHQRWMRGNYACFYDQYEEALEHYAAAQERLNPENDHVGAHRLAIAYGKAATYFMMRQYAEALEHYQGVVSELKRDPQLAAWLQAGDAPAERTVGSDSMWWAPLDYLESYISSLCRSVIAAGRLGRDGEADAMLISLRKLATECGSHFRLDVAHVLHQEAVQLPLQYGVLPMAIEMKQLVYDLLRGEPQWGTGELGELQLSLAESNANCGDLAKAHEIVSMLLEQELIPPLEEFATVLAGNLSCQAGELAAAINLYEQAIRLRTEMFGRDSSAAAICRIVICEVFRIYGDFDAARASLAGIAPQFLSTEGEHRLTACRVRATMAGHQGDFDVVEEMFEVLMRDASTSDSPVELAETHLLEAFCWMNQDNPQFALQSAKAALEIAETVYPADNPVLCRYLTACAWLSVPTSTHDAQQWLDRARTALGQRTRTHKLQHLHLLQTEAELSLATGDVDASDQQLRVLEEEANRIFLSTSITNAELQCVRGEVFLAMGRVEEAAKWLQTSLQTHTASGQPESHPSRRHPLEKLSEAFRRLGDTEGVERCEQRLQEIKQARQKPGLQTTDNPYQT